MSSDLNEIIEGVLRSKEDGKEHREWLKRLERYWQNRRGFFSRGQTE